MCSSDLSSCSIKPQTAEADRTLISRSSDGEERGGDTREAASECMNPAVLACHFGDGTVCSISLSLSFALSVSLSLSISFFLT